MIGVVLLLVVLTVAMALVLVVVTMLIVAALLLLPGISNTDDLIVHGESSYRPPYVETISSWCIQRFCPQS